MNDCQTPSPRNGSDGFAHDGDRADVAGRTRRQIDAWELAGELRDDPDITRLLQEARQPVGRSRRVWHTSLAVAATLLLSLSVLLWYPGIEHHPDTMALIAPIGSQHIEQLPDASRVILNSGSRLVATFNKSSRIVTLLEGEATFEVERDGRTFEVHTPEGITRVLGTVFNVRVADNGTVQVSVLEGKVQVASAKPQRGRGQVELTPGQAIDYDHRGLSSIKQADADRILSWHSGRIRFQEWPLSRVIEEYNRYTSQKVRVVGGEDILLSGSFTLENKEELLSTLENVYHVRIQPVPSS